MIFILVVKHPQTDEKAKSIFVIIFCGVVLGLIASFLGVGGGPINVAILILIFKM